jgi:hypothetical protein
MRPPALSAAREFEPGFRPGLPGLGLGQRVGGNSEAYCASARRLAVGCAALSSATITLAPQTPPSSTSPLLPAASASGGWACEARLSLPHSARCKRINVDMALRAIALFTPPRARRVQPGRPVASPAPALCGNVPIPDHPPAIDLGRKSAHYGNDRNASSKRPALQSNLLTGTHPGVR